MKIKPKIRIPLQLIIILLLSSAICLSCTQPYKTIEGDSSGLLCIDASLVKNRETQRIVISRSISNTDDPIPYVKGCTVYVEDESGDTRYFTETSKGVYTADIEDEYLVINQQYRLFVETASGEIYQSDYETLLDCPAVDSVYTIEEEAYSYSQEKYLTGLRFYVDLKVVEGFTPYYKWLLEEDWKYEVPYAYYAIWTGDTIISFRKAQTELKTCYMHDTLAGLYSASTENVISIKKKNPLAFIPLNSKKFRLKYSMRISQLSLTTNAYAYWQRKKEDMEESSGIYVTQPSQLISNIKNTSNEEETVLGYFWAGTQTQKRIFFNESLNYLDFYSDCSVDSVDSISKAVSYVDTFKINNFVVYDIAWKPVLYEKYHGDYHIMPACYLLYDTCIASQSCINCLKHGGDTTVPEFWR